MRFRTSDALHATALVAVYLGGLSLLLGGLEQVLPTKPWQLVSAVPLPIAFGMNRLSQWWRRGAAVMRLPRSSWLWAPWGYVGAWLAIFGALNSAVSIAVLPDGHHPIAMQGHGALLVALWGLFVCRDTLLCENGVSTFWWFASWDEIRLDSEESPSKLVVFRTGELARWRVTIPEERLAEVRSLLAAKQTDSKA